METHKICTGQSDALISLSVFIRRLKIHKQLFQFRQCAPNVRLSHRKKDQLEKEKKKKIKITSLVLILLQLSGHQGMLVGFFTTCAFR